jgi:multidrug resistance efflux pump
MRFAKVGIGVALIAFALFVIFGEQLAGASADAFVNARLTMTRAQIAGTLRLQAPVLGSRIRRGDTLGEITDPLVDSVRLSDLVTEQAKNEAETVQIRATLISVEESIELLQTRAQTYRAERTRQLEAQLGASNATADASKAQLSLYRQMLQRSTQLSSRGVETTGSLEQAQSRVEVAQKELENAQAQATVNQVSLEAARRGTFLGDGYNDAPYSEQRISELQLRREELTADLTAQLAAKVAVEERIRAERLRVNRLTSAPLQANVSGIFWSLPSADGETVQRGQDLFQLVDCDSTIVTLSVSESVYNSLQIGKEAEFRLSGSSQVFPATIIRLAGAGAESIYKNLAIAASQKHLERFDVALAVPELLSKSELRCQVGRTGRVFFQRRPLDWIRQIWR